MSKEEFDLKFKETLILGCQAVSLIFDILKPQLEKNNEEHDKKTRDELEKRLDNIIKKKNDKQKIYSRLRGLELYGIKLSKQYSMKDDIIEMKSELKFHLKHHINSMNILLLEKNKEKEEIEANIKKLQDEYDSLT